ncbi:transmembrane protease serine 9-like [Paramacrobiotus metropolitanus]|uniref:transmembrane protease serine 9-like n=1 Tax=Paramacrobiotus metropolitanus TaxID=2943436 RepID=UPI002445A0FC|nr:transmembrane protease serine 9-like [Paramacrobiotus metropolitanus]
MAQRLVVVFLAQVTVILLNLPGYSSLGDVMPTVISERITLDANQPYLLKSLQYPARYPPGTVYVYSISGAGQPIKIAFKSFSFGLLGRSTQYNDGCTGERVNIWDTKSPAVPIKFACGTSSEDVVSDGDTIIIEPMVGDLPTATNSFLLELTRVQCGRSTPLSCPSETSKCITRDQICDGIMQCPQGEDEICTMDCGQHSGAIDTSENLRILGGIPVQENSWPWHVRLLIPYLENNQVVWRNCQGAVIASRWVMTAAQCVANSARDAATMKALGANNLISVAIMPHNCTFDHTLIMTQRIFLHPLWQTKRDDSLFYDMALLYLFVDIPFSDAVRPVCLPRPNTGANIGETCYVAGCGTTSPGARDQLLQSALPIAPLSTCLGHFWPTPDKVCAAPTNGTSACVWGTGGPLACRRETLGMNQWILSGTISYGDGCMSTPAGFAAIPMAMPFIMQTLYAQSFQGWFANRTVPRIGDLEPGGTNQTASQDSVPVPLRSEPGPSSSAEWVVPRSSQITLPAEVSVAFTPSCILNILFPSINGVLDSGTVRFVNQP